MKSAVHKNLTQFSRKRRGDGLSREANEMRTVIYADFSRNPFNARIVRTRFMRLAFTKKQTEASPLIWSGFRFLMIFFYFAASNCGVIVSQMAVRIPCALFFSQEETAMTLSNS